MNARDATPRQTDNITDNRTENSRPKMIPLRRHLSDANAVPLGPRPLINDTESNSPNILVLLSLLSSLCLLLLSKMVGEDQGIGIVETEITTEITEITATV